MMKKLRLTALIAVLFLVLTLCLTACGGGAYSGAPAQAAPVPAEAPEMDYGAAEDTAAPAGESGGGGPTLTPPQDNRKVVITANLTIETLEFTDTCNQIQQLAQTYGGYISATNIDNAGKGARYASFTVRVPADQYTTFIGVMEQTGNLTSRNEQSEDVTSQYVDIESRLKTLRAEEEWLLAELADSTGIDYLISLRERLTEVQTDIEYYTTNLRALNDLTSYSTVNITVYEVQEYTEPPKESYGDRIVSTFSEAWQITLQVLQLTFLFLIAIHPLLIFLAVVLVIVLVVVRLVKAHNAKHPPKPAPPAPPAPRPPMPPMPPYGAPYGPYAPRPTPGTPMPPMPPMPSAGPAAPVAPPPPASGEKNAQGTPDAPAKK